MPLECAWPEQNPLMPAETATLEAILEQGLPVTAEPRRTHRGQVVGGRAGRETMLSQIAAAARTNTRLRHTLWHLGIACSTTCINKSRPGRCSP